MTEEQRRGIIWRKLARLETRAAPSLSTGFPALDKLLGAGGLPRGAMVEWFGPPSSGKTTLALQTSACLQAGGAVAAWVDADRTFDPLYAAALGVALDRLPVVQPETAEEALEMAVQLVNSGALDLLIVDSAAALTPRLELGASLVEAGGGLQGRVLASGLRKLGVALRRNAAAALFLNQTRAHPESGPGESEASAGGSALKLYSAVRIVFQPEAGGRLRLRALKGRAGAALLPCVLERREPSGFVEAR